jgi:hypothetical protein
MNKNILSISMAYVRNGIVLRKFYEPAPPPLSREAPVVTLQVVKPCYVECIGGIRGGPLLVSRPDSACDKLDR